MSAALPPALAVGTQPQTTPEETVASAVVDAVAGETKFSKAEVIPKEGIATKTDYIYYRLPYTQSCSSHSPLYLTPPFNSSYLSFIV
jgi:hypothetical protein